MSNWKVYKHVGGGRGAHLHPISGKKFLGEEFRYTFELFELRLMHLHGWCMKSGGGVRQEDLLNL